MRHAFVHEGKHNTTTAMSDMAVINVTVTSCAAVISEPTGDERCVTTTNNSCVGDFMDSHTVTQSDAEFS